MCMHMHNMYTCWPAASLSTAHVHVHAHAQHVYMLAGGLPQHGTRTCACTCTTCVHAGGRPPSARHTYMCMHMHNMYTCWRAASLSTAHVHVHAHAQHVYML